MKEKRDIGHLRKHYDMGALTKENANKNPFKQFDRWFQDALKSDVFEPNAFSLATVDSEGKPDARIVLLKEYSGKGFVFYTNYKSKKGRDLSATPYATMCFYWDGLARQVRISGKVEKLSRKESEAYFDSRPEESKISAVVSWQSTEIPNREFLKAKKDDFREKNERITCPAYWGGFRVVPQRFEFWQGRPSRLHDRLSYEQKGKNWHIRRLAP